MPTETLLPTPSLDRLQSSSTPPVLERLSKLYGRAGPFVSVYLATEAQVFDRRAPLLDRWRLLREELVLGDASRKAIEAIDQRLSMDMPAQTKGVCVLAAADGMSLVDYDLVAPDRDSAEVGALPAVDQLIEWQTRRIPSLMITIDGEHAEVTSYAVKRLGRRYSLRHPPAAMVMAIAKLATAVNAELVLIAGACEEAQSVAEALPLRLPLGCRVVSEPDVVGNVELTEACIGHLGIAAAGTTLLYLREQRFFAAHGGAVDGLGETIGALRSGAVKLLLVHQRRSDDRTVWVGARPHDISEVETNDCQTEVSLVDGLLRSAILQRVVARIVPHTGPSSPTDNVAAVLALDRQQLAPLKL